MSVTQITNLARADFEICCNHTDKRSCIRTVNAIQNNFNNIVEITAVEPYGGIEDMCVIGIAMIHPEKKAKFQRALKRLRITNDGSMVIKKAVVEIIE